MLSTVTLTALCVGSLLGVDASPTQHNKLPIVNLGYQHHKAINFDEAGQFYNFSNIRYAQPPTGKLRFTKPVAPAGRGSHIEDGAIGHVCPGAFPAWFSIAPQFMGSYLQGKPFDEDAAWAAVNASTPPPPNPSVSEDCLFLDVDVPKATFDKAQKGRNHGAPVLVWIHGGGYVAGSKNTSPGNGLIEASRSTDSDGIIYVRLNYRLGAFGFLNGESTALSGTLNAGLYDQRLALNWVQKYIHLFGGDPKRVTVLGESGGGEGIMSQLTAFGGKERAPFSRAIVQSAPSPFNGDKASQNSYEKAFLQRLKVSNIEEARRLPTELLIAANAAVIRASPYGIFGFHIVAGDDFVQDRISNLLQRGAYDKRVEVMISHTSNEGLFFTNPVFQHADRVEKEFASLISLMLPRMTDTDKEYLANELYPASYDGSQPYSDAVRRASLFFSDAFFLSYFNTMADVFGPKSFAYEFAVGAGLHTDDVAYDFYTGVESTVKFPTVARSLQQYITSFAVCGMPKAQGATEFVPYGQGRNMLQLGNGDITASSDTTENKRVQWLQDWYSKNGSP